MTTDELRVDEKALRVAQEALADAGLGMPNTAAQIAVERYLAALPAHAPSAAGVRCHCCEREAVLVKGYEVRQWGGARGELPFFYAAEDEHWRCEACGEEWYTVEQSRRLDSQCLHAITKAWRELASAHPAPTAGEAVAWQVRDNRGVAEAFLPTSDGAEQCRAACDENLPDGAPHTVRPLYAYPTPAQGGEAVLREAALLMDCPTCGSKVTSLPLPTPRPECNCPARNVLHYKTCPCATPRPEVTAGVAGVQKNGAFQKKLKVKEKDWAWLRMLANDEEGHPRYRAHARRILTALQGEK